MSDYTPTTEEIRLDYAPAKTFPADAEAQFDRWLAEVKADAWEEGYAHGNADAFTEARLDRDNPYRQGEGQQVSYLRHAERNKLELIPEKPDTHI